MSTNYNAIAEEYKSSKLLPWRLHVESYTYLKKLGDLSGLKILDLACGEGFYSRIFKLKGASKVVGVDLSDEMIRLAKEAEGHNPVGIEYHAHNVLSLELNEKFDLVCASYLLNYAKSPEELNQMVKVISKHLKPNGRFVTVNSNPDYKGSVDTMLQYGFTRENIGNEEGSEIIYRFYQPNGTHISVTNYHHEKSTHETVLKEAELSNIQWHPIEVSPEIKEGNSDVDWTDILTNQPVICMSCSKV